MTTFRWTEEQCDWIIRVSALLDQTEPLLMRRVPDMTRFSIAAFKRCVSSRHKFEHSPAMGLSVHHAKASWEFFVQAISAMSDPDHTLRTVAQGLMVEMNAIPPAKSKSKEESSE